MIAIKRNVGLLGMALGLGMTTALSGSLSAQPTGSVIYEMEQGDTLIELARDNFTSERAIRTIMRINRIRDPKRIPIGKRLTIPRDLLKWDPAELFIDSFSNPVTITVNGNPVTPAKNYAVPEGAQISTGASGFIALRGTGKSRISLPSNSTVTIVGARRYRINEALDFDVRVDRGRSEVTAPKLTDQERYKVRSKRAVTAVRGTEYRVAYDPELDRSLAEVIEGEVQVSSGDTDVALTEQLGVSASPAGLGQPEKLLDAAQVIEPSKTQTSEQVTFKISPLEGATAYRAQIFRDQTFNEIISEKVVDGNEVTFDQLNDGRLAVRIRAVAASGLEGLYESHSFRRKRVGSQAGQSPSPFADAFKFVWTPEGEGKSFNGFQLWDKANPGELIVDEVGLEVGGLYVSDLRPGRYVWRLATFQVLEGDEENEPEVIKVWSPPEEFSVVE